LNEELWHFGSCFNRYLYKQLFDKENDYPRGNHMKKMVCRCHDVTESDIESAIDTGYDDFETLKRITGITTGHCQGKTCMSLAMGILARKTGNRVEETQRIRAPIDPVTLGALTTKKKE
jgi:bacterioferritin-associated ferredoxin